MFVRELLLAFFALLNVVHANDFFKKYCSEWHQGTLHICKNFDFISGDIEIISNASRIIIEKSYIDNLNTEFFNKFPNSSSITIKYSTVNFTEKGSRSSHPLTDLKLFYTKVFGNKNTTALGSLSNLRNVEVVLPTVECLEYPHIDTKFFINNSNLETLTLSFFSIKNDFTDNFLEDGSLDSLRKLSYVVYIFGKQKHISKNLFKNNGQLKYLELYSNEIDTIDQEALPSSLESLDISKNNIKDIHGIFTNLVSLEKLLLFNNKIETIKEDTFKSLQNLKVLDISHNKIKSLHMRYFDSRKKLRTLHATDNDNLEWDKDLEKLILNFVV
ncbi:Tl.2 family protein [Megaselia abdita]